MTDTRLDEIKNNCTPYNLKCLVAEYDALRVQLAASKKQVVELREKAELLDYLQEQGYSLSCYDDEWWVVETNSGCAKHVLEARQSTALAALKAARGE